MNERIRELAGQAGFDTEHHKWIFANDNAGEGECHKLLEKFAELIVQETVLEVWIQLFNHGIDLSENTLFLEAMKKTKEKFGVTQ